MKFVFNVFQIGALSSFLSSLNTMVVDELKWNGERETLDLTLIKPL